MSIWWVAAALTALWWAACGAAPFACWWWYERHGAREAATVVSGGGEPAFTDPIAVANAVRRLDGSHDHFPGMAPDTRQVVTGHCEQLWRAQ